MAIKIYSAAFTGIEGVMVTVEVDIKKGLPCFNIVGMGDIAVKESRERVRSAILNSGFNFPLCRITVNLAPGDMKKEGTLFDLPIAIGILRASHQLYCKRTDEYLFIGELSLSGELQGIRGSLAIITTAFRKGISDFIVPLDNADECSIIKEAKIFPFRSLLEVTSFLRYKDSKPYKNNIIQLPSEDIPPDFNEVIGQESTKRALEVAAAGNHCVLLFGPPGSGKTMLAKRLPSILPELSYKEAIEVTKIYSVSGKLEKYRGMIKNRPFRMPHHTSTIISLAGGGASLMPGEISLAHNGVLFLDEILEFKKDVLEVLRQPLEDRQITISRLSGSATYPANIMLVGALNPCPCGYFRSGVKECTCKEAQKKKYISKLSGPLLDRVDIFSFVGNIEYGELSSKRGSENSGAIRKRVEDARDLQRERFKNEDIFCNAQMGQRLIEKYCKLNNPSKMLLEQIYERYKLSVRAYSRILKVSRTIADMKLRESIEREDIIEAIQYRRFIDDNVI